MGADPGSLSWTGGAAALLAAATLLAGIGGLATRSSGLRPWLAVLFGINAGAGDVSPDTLRAIKPIDILLLSLAGVTFIGFRPGPGTRQVPWIPGDRPAIRRHRDPAGHTPWGSLGSEGGALVLSILMLVSDAWTGLGYVGIAASVLLLVGTSGQADVGPE